jgi:hypothetical protein
LTGSTSENKTEKAAFSPLLIELDDNSDSFSESEDSKSWDSFSTEDELSEEQAHRLKVANGKKKGNTHIDFLEMVIIGPPLSNIYFRKSFVRNEEGLSPSFYKNLIF